MFAQSAGKVLGILIAAWMAAAAHAGDTTYSDTRAVPRQRESSNPIPSSTGDSHPDRDHGYDSDDDEDRGGSLEWSSDNPRERFFASCMSQDNMDLKAAMGYVLLLPFRLGFCYGFDNFRQSHIDLFTGSADMETIQDRYWRLGWGFGFGGMRLPNAAGAMPFTLHAEGLHAFSPSRQVRIRLGTFGSLAGATSDYARTAFVGGEAIGTQTDHIRTYSLSGYPLTVEGLLTGAGGLYLAVGGGAMVIREGLYINRSTSYGSPEQEIFDKRMRARPVASVSIGRFQSRGGGRKFHRFELRYEAAWLAPERRSSFPGDNTTALHSLTWDWAWLW